MHFSKEEVHLPAVHDVVTCVRRYTNENGESHYVSWIMTYIQYAVCFVALLKYDAYAPANDVFHRLQSGGECAAGVIRSLV